MAPRPEICIIGRGRVGGALARALRRAACDARAFGRPRNARDEARAAAAIARAGVVFLCVPDDAIAEVARSHAERFRAGQVVAHCSGALDLSALAPARAAHLGSLHPLCAVPSPRAALAGASAAVSGDRQASRTLARLARAAGMKPFDLPVEDRARYHVAAVLASNGLVALAAEAARLLGQCGVEERAALEALLPLMRSALSGLEAHRLPGALTGPIARGDSAVVRAHLSALSSPGDARALELYRALGAALLALSQRLGRASPDQLRLIAAAVSGARGGGRRAR
ncbi:MAG: DUF2520 domain-containing protein [Myxococcales bacterium]|jgi:predicted short-subunit dehydrogenase-like oxidoreductase (DUF2520 family)